MIELQAQLKPDKVNERLDQVLARQFPDYSRSRIQQWIKSGYVALDNEVATNTRHKVMGGELCHIQAQQEMEVNWSAEDVPISIIYEDEDILIINKQSDLVVHPAAGNYSGTLVNGLLNHCPELEAIPRAGIVHRLDKDTTGLLVVAKTLTAHHNLVGQLKARTVGRHYRCLVYGQMVAGGTVDQPLGRHPVNRKLMAVVSNGKPAITHYRINQRLGPFTLLDIKLETGRTHQIRVHMQWLKYPLVGDPVYGGRLRKPKGCNQALQETLANFKRQALHARELQLTHPRTSEIMTWTTELPEDFSHLVSCIAKNYNDTESSIKHHSS